MHPTRHKLATPICGVTDDAAALGVSRATLRRCLNGRNIPTLVVLHGPKESARLVGETGAAPIRAALKSAL